MALPQPGQDVKGNGLCGRLCIGFLFLERFIFTMCLSSLSVTIQTQLLFPNTHHFRQQHMFPIQVIEVPEGLLEDAT